MTDTLAPTCYPEVNAILALLQDEVQRILGPYFAGMYLYGSLAGGDFDPGSSDIDFLVVTGCELPAEVLPALEAMHARIAASKLPWAGHLEGSYIPRKALWRYDPANARHPTIGFDWPFQVGFHDATWVLNRRLIREKGVTLAGPPPASLIDPVGPDELRDAVREVLMTRWSGDLSNPDWLRPRTYQAFAILTMARALYLLDTGEMASKPVAAAWAQEYLEPRWASLAAEALEWRHDQAPGEVEATLAFIRWTVDQARKSLNVGKPAIGVAPLVGREHDRRER